MARITGIISALLVGTIGLSLVLRANYVKKSKNIKASIKKLKPKRNYYQQATVEEIIPSPKPSFEPAESSSFMTAELSEDAPFADGLGQEEGSAEHPNYRRRSPGDKI